MNRSLLLCGAAQVGIAVAFTSPALTQPAPNAQPTGGNVVAGSASIAHSAQATTINQATQRAAINWQRFDVGSQQTVQFNQPSANAVTLNRVVGPDPSQIAGRIDANGKIIITNQSGVMFYRGSQVNTNGLMVTAAGISNSNFMAGRMVFDQAPKPDARVVNNGSITVREAGLAALVAPQVANSGVINAKLGHVILAGARTATLDMYGDGLVSIDVTSAVQTLTNGASALVTNSGVIAADGGTVQLTARAADGVVQQLVDAGGTIRAASVGDRTGSITLDGVGGSITVHGQVVAEGTTPGTKGGDIVVNPSGNVVVASTARINASGEAGGGTVALGTTLQRAKGGPGTVATHTASGVTVQRGAVIAANAKRKGDGGHVTILSTDATDMAGAISARGGPLGGNGGFVEVSGDKSYALTGSIDVTAPLGNIGTILLDPTDLFVVNGTAGAGGLDGSFSGGTLASSVNNPGTLTNNVSNGEIQQLGSTGNVILQTSPGSIVVQASIVVTNGLSLEAGSDLLVDRGVTISAGGGLFLSAGTSAGTGSILLGTTSVVGAGIPGPTVLSAPSIVMQAGSASAGNFGISLSDSTLTSATGAATVVDLSATTGGINQSVAGVINTATLLSSGGVGGTVNLPGTSNAIANLSTFAISNGGLNLTTTGRLGVSGPVSASSASSINAGTIAITGTIGVAPTASLNLFSASGDITMTGAALVSGGNINMNAAAGINEASTGTIAANSFSASATNDITLNGTANAIANVSGVNSTNGAVRLILGTSAVLTGQYSGSTLFIEVAQTSGTLQIGTTFNGATLAANAPTNPTISLVADNITRAGTIIAGSPAATITITTGANGTTELAPFTSGTPISLAGTAAGAGTLEIDPTLLGAINTGTGSLRIGGFTGGGVTAGNISLDGGVNLGLVANTLELDSNGAVTETAANALTVGTLTGSMVSASLLGGKGIGTLGPIKIGGGDFVLTDAGGLAVTGPVTGANNATINADTITVSGSVIAANVLAMTSGFGGITLNSGAVLNGATVALDGATGGILLTGNAILGAPTEVVDLSASNNQSGLGVFQSGGTVIAAILQSSTGVAGSVTLNNNNTVASIGNFAVSGTLGSFSLTNAAGQNLAVAGTLNASQDVTLTTSGTGGISATGSIISGNSLLVASGSGGIAMTGNALLQGFFVGLNSGAGVTEPGTGTIIATRFGASAANGPITLNGTANAINTVVGLDATNGAVRLVVGAPTVLTGLNTGTDLFYEVVQPGGTLQIGAIRAPATLVATGATNPTISLTADNITEGPSVSTITTGAGGTMEIAPFTAATPVSLGGTFGPVGTLVLDATLLGDITTGGGLLRVGRVTGGTTTAGNIGVDGSVNLGTVAAILELDSTGAITETAPIALTVATLTGTAAAGVDLAGTANAIATLGSFSTAGDFALVDGTALGVTGPLTANNVALTSLGTGIDLAGNVTATGTANLRSSGTIAQSGGSVTAKTLTGTAGGDVRLVSSNAVANLASFSVTGGSFVLENDGAALTVSGPVAATNIVTLSAAPTLTISGSIIAPNTIVLNPGTGGLNLTGTAVIGPSGTVAVASSGPITEAASAVVNAGTLVIGSQQSVAFDGANTIGTLGPFGAGNGDFRLTALGSVDVIGPGSANNIALTAGALAVDGVVVSLGSLSIAATTGGIALNGGSVLRTTNLDLSAPNGGVTQAAGGQISVTSLQSAQGFGTGLSLGAVSNRIGTLGPISVGSGGSLVVFDSAPLTITGPIAADFLNITATGRMTLAGDIATIGAPLAQQSGATPAPGGSTLQVLPAGGVTAPTPTQFVQTGFVTLTDPPATTLRIQLPATGGSASFAGLNGPTANLVLGLGNGTASGVVNVAGLLVLGAGGNATLTGSVAGITGSGAAAKGQISPALDVQYTFNGCELGAAFCTPLSSLPQVGQPVLGGLSPFIPGVRPPPLPDVPPGLDLIMLVMPPVLSGDVAPQDVVPPNISFEDF